MGGAQIHAQNLAVALGGRRHHMAVAAMHCGDVADALGDRDIWVTQVTRQECVIVPAQRLGSRFEFHAFLRKEESELVSLRSSKAGLIGRLTAGLAHAGAVFTACGWTLTDCVSA